MNSPESSPERHVSNSAKEKHELSFWEGLLKPNLNDEAKLAQQRKFYEFFFTEFFGLTKDDYVGKKLLDVGCGPMGSLEWASMAAERVGLDPLVPQYQQLVGRKHAMTYCAACAESIPYPDGYFDSVSTFNSLDHVDDVAQAIKEMKRVTRPDGRILLIVEIDHPASETEPHTFTRSILDDFGPEFRSVDTRLYGVHDQFALYAAMENKVPYVAGKPGLLVAHLVRASQ